MRCRSPDRGTECQSACGTDHLVHRDHGIPTGVRLVVYSRRTGEGCQRLYRTRQGSRLAEACGWPTEITQACEEMTNSADFDRNQRSSGEYRLKWFDTNVYRMTPNNKMFRAIQAGRNARRLLVITGAGVSAESGIPTFRDPSGWWRKFKPEELATREAFNRDPAEVWRWYDMRRAMIAGAEPNLAHRALARAEASGCRVAIVTQNVDDLHERAGSREVIHVHGSIWQLKCTVDGTVFEDRRVPLPSIPPRCPNGHLARPNIVWWDEELDPTVAARVNALVNERFDVVLVVGTEATFDYIRDWALTARTRGGLLVEVNLRTTDLTPDVDVRIEGKAAEVLNDILAG